MAFTRQLGGAVSKRQMDLSVMMDIDTLNHAVKSRLLWTHCVIHSGIQGRLQGRIGSDPHPHQTHERHSQPWGHCCSLLPIGADGRVLSPFGSACIYVSACIYLSAQCKLGSGIVGFMTSEALMSNAPIATSTCTIGASLSKRGQVGSFRCHKQRLWMFEMFTCAILVVECGLPHGDRNSVCISVCE